MKNSLCIILLMMALSTSVKAGGIPIDDQSVSKMDKNNGHWLAPEEARSRKNPIQREIDSINRGRDLYRLNCMSCHGETAEGNGPAAAVLTPEPGNLKKMSGTHSDSDFAWKIENGRGPMPAWKNVLSENQIWDLVNYIQSLSGSGRVQHDDKH